MTSPIRRIMIVDDHDAVRRGVRNLVETKPYYQVVGEAANGRDALELARDTNPDITILDYSLPECNGVDVAQAIQKDPAVVNVPIVMMTAIPFGAIGKKAIAAGCVSFLSKPCAPSRLLLELKRFLPAA